MRDLGGLRTRDGGETARGAVVRSGSPDGLSERGWEALRAYGIRTIVDLRNDDEQRGGAADGRRDAAPAARRRRRTRSSGTAGPAGRSSARRSTTCRTCDRFPDRNARVIEAIARAEPGGVLFHCVGGRDRTGQITLLLLALAGVEPGADRRRLLPEPRTRATTSWRAAARSSTEVILAILAELDVEAYLRERRGQRGRSGGGAGPAARECGPRTRPSAGRLGVHTPGRRPPLGGARLGLVSAAATGLGRHSKRPAQQLRVGHRSGRASGACRPRSNPCPALRATQSSTFTRRGQRRPAARMTRWSELATPPTSGGVTRPSTRLGPEDAQRRADLAGRDRPVGAERRSRPLAAASPRGGGPTARRGPRSSGGSRARRPRSRAGAAAARRRASPSRRPPAAARPGGAASSAGSAALPPQAACAAGAEARHGGRQRAYYRRAKWSSPRSSSHSSSRSCSPCRGR